MKQEFRIVSSEEIEDKNSLTEKLIDIDYKCFGELQDEDEGTVDEWNSVRDNIFTNLILVDNTIVGYIDFVNINKDGIDNLLNGKLRDGKIFNFIEKKTKSNLTLYIISIAILDEYRDKGLAGLLWNKARDYFIKNKYSVDKVYANIWTESGWNFFNKFNIELKKIDDAGHRIVEIKTINNQLPTYK